VLKKNKSMAESLEMALKEKRQFRERLKIMYQLTTSTFKKFAYGREDCPDRLLILMQQKERTKIIT